MTDPQTVLKDYFYVGMSLCNFCMFNVFWCKDVFSMNVCHLFPQCMLVVVFLIGKLIGIVITCTCLDVEQGLPFALCLLLPCQGQGFLPSCWSRRF